MLEMIKEFVPRIFIFITMATLHSCISTRVHWTSVKSHLDCAAYVRLYRYNELSSHCQKVYLDVTIYEKQKFLIFSSFLKHMRSDFMFWGRTSFVVDIY